MKRFCFCCLILLCSLPAFASTGTAILFDVSRSVPAEDFRTAQETVRKFMESAGPEDRILLYTFGNDLHKIQPEDLMNLQATESYTMLFDAAYDAAQELDQEKAERKSIVIISDGHDTKSATILEDTASFVNLREIAVYGLGVGKVERKTLERLAKLTGGQYFPIDTPDLVLALREAQTSQKMVSTAEPAPASPPPASSPEVAPLPAEPAAQPAPSRPAEKPKRSLNLMWPLGIAGGLILLIGIVWILSQALKKEERVCTECGRPLETYQTVCPSCHAPSGMRRSQSPDSTQDLAGGEDEPELIPVELLQKRPVTEEMLSNTFVLMETPLLVIRKGRNIGQSFALNRVYPVSIGRSRVNEIKLDDVAVSGQHCRIIPENGRHVLYDLESTNGTFVNDKRVNKLVLSEGDIVRVGETQFLFKVEQQRN